MTKYNSTDGKTVLETSDDAVKAAWGGSWRMPTKEEIDVLVGATYVYYTTNYQDSNVTGLIFKDKTDLSKELFFPCNGYVSG